jgi:hypothetical protein
MVEILVSMEMLAARGVTYPQIETFVQFMRNRLNEYELWVQKDGSFLLAGEPVTDNQLICILKRDAESREIKALEGKPRDYVIKNSLGGWRKRTLAHLKTTDKEKIRVKLELEKR